LRQKAKGLGCLLEQHQRFGRLLDRATGDGYRRALLLLLCPGSSHTDETGGAIVLVQSLPSGFRLLVQSLPSGFRLLVERSGGAIVLVQCLPSGFRLLALDDRPGVIVIGDGQIDRLREIADGFLCHRDES